MQPPASGADWLGISAEPLPIAAALEWAVRPDCGAQVLFSGTVRDSSDGRPDVSTLTYEAYDEQVAPRMAGIADEARLRWPAIGPIVMLHRVGELAVGESAVVVVVAAPHRPDAFAAARFCIDTLKASVPIWKKETWVDGEAWGSDATPIEQPGGVR